MIFLFFPFLLCFMFTGKLIFFYAMLVTLIPAMLPHVLGAIPGAIGGIFGVIKGFVFPKKAKK